MSPRHLPRPSVLPRLLALASLLQPLGAAWLQALQRRQLAPRSRPPAQESLFLEAHPRLSRARVLLLGDSTGVGTGAGHQEQSLPTLLEADFPGAEIVNQCQSGALVGDALQQLRPLLQAGERFDLALLLVGGNDALHLTPQRKLARQAATLLRGVTAIARHTVWMGCADIGQAAMPRPPAAWWTNWQSHCIVGTLAWQARAANVPFIDFCSPHGLDVFARERRRLLVRDGVHPSAASHRLCCSALRRHAPMAQLLAAGLPFDDPRRPMAFPTLSERSPTLAGDNHAQRV